MVSGDFKNLTRRTASDKICMYGLVYNTKWSHSRVFWIFKKILSCVFPGNYLKWKLILLLTFHHQYKVFNISKNKNMTREVLLQWFIDFLIKNFWWCCYAFTVRDLTYAKINLLLKMYLCQTKNYLSNYMNQLLENLWKKVHSPFMGGGSDLADGQLISKFNEGIHFLLCVIDVFSKYTWVIPLKDKKGITIINELIIFKKL